MGDRAQGKTGKPNYSRRSARSRHRLLIWRIIPWLDKQRDTVHAGWGPAGARQLLLYNHKKPVATAIYVAQSFTNILLETSKTLFLVPFLQMKKKGKKNRCWTFLAPFNLQRSLLYSTWCHLNPPLSHVTVVPRCLLCTFSVKRTLYKRLIFLLHWKLDF